MGMHASSGYAQRFGNAILQAFCERMDSEEQEHECLKGELVRAWLAARRTIPHDDYGTQARLMCALQYTDDSLMQYVGPQIGVAMLVSFCRMIGPHYFLHTDAGEAARGTFGDRGAQRPPPRGGRGGPAGGGEAAST